MKANALYITLWLLLPVFSFSQIPDTLNPLENSTEQKIENLLEDTEGETDLTEITEELENYRKNPLNLNTASAEELFRMNLLDPIQIENLLAYRKRYGLFKTIFELAYIEGFDMPAINRILPFVTVAPVKGSNALKISDLSRGRHQLLLRYQEVLEPQAGYSAISDSLLQKSPNSRYIGSPQKLYLRYSWSLFNRFSAGITAEKDAGEEFFKGNRKDGFDFYSAHLSYTGKGLIKNLILGDYSVNMGQGLVCYSGVSFGKGGGPLSIRKRSTVIRRYTSADENRFFRGAAITIGKGPIEVSAFGSSKKIDGSIEIADSLDEEENYIQSFQETGSHATASEISSRKTIGQKLAGGRISYNKRILSLGFSHLSAFFDKNKTQGSSLYQQYDFSGKHQFNTGADFTINLPNLLFFGEAALNQNNSKAMLAGMLASPDPRLGFALLYRNYDKSYNGIFTNGFGEASSTSNERGIYIGLRLQPLSKFILSAYADIFSFPWLRYRLDKPSTGSEYYIQGDYQLSRNVSIYMRYKKENKPINPSASTEMINRPEEQIRHNFRFNIDYRVSSTLKLRSRYESSSYSLFDKTSKGYLVFQDVVYDLPKTGLSIYLRYALFDTDDYDSRIYTFENDLLYTFSVPSFYDRGARSYAMLRYSLGRYADIWLKLSQTAYTDKQLIGSGLTEIQGSKKTELRLQLRLKW